MIDHALQHNTGLQNANRGLDDMLSSGSSILSGLREQRNVLKVIFIHSFIHSLTHIIQSYIHLFI